VHRYNAAGLPGLHDGRSKNGGKSRLNGGQMAELAEAARRDPDLACGSVVRWRRADLARLIAERLGVVLAERSVGARLRRLGSRRLCARPCHLDTFDNRVNVLSWCF
jgi:transposase